MNVLKLLNILNELARVNPITLDREVSVVQLPEERQCFGGAHSLVN